MATDDKAQDAIGLTPFATARFKARVGAAATSNLGESFWSAIGGSPDQTWTLKTGEAELRTKFPAILARRLVAASGRPAAEAGELRFEVRDIRYGSIEFLIALSSIKAFAGLFAGVPPDLVLKIVETCVVESFRETIGGRPPSEATVTPSSELLLALSPTASQKKSGSWADVLNASLGKVFWLVPTLLALGAWLVAMSAMDGDAKRAHARESDLAKHYRERESELARNQKVVFDLLKERVDKLEALTLDMSKQLGQPADAASTACTACCSTPCCCTVRTDPKPPATPPATRSCRK